VPSASETASAQKEGVRDAIKESAKDTYEALTDGNLPGEPAAHASSPAWTTSCSSNRCSTSIRKHSPLAWPRMRIPVLPEEKAAGLLSLERAGRNRTPYVRSLMKRLKIDHPGEVTNAGPGYTNDIHPISKL
jgi:hypothetical protein